MLWKGIASTDHPVLAHIIPMRRCNLACAYCNEYDDFSKPVPIETMIGRLDRLADLGTTVVSVMRALGRYWFEIVELPHGQGNGAGGAASPP